jgi:hypothetical protein
MPNWREEELTRLRKEYNFYKDTEILDEITGCLRSKTLKLIIDYHERMLGNPSDNNTYNNYKHA